MCSSPWPVLLVFAAFPGAPSPLSVSACCLPLRPVSLVGLLSFLLSLCVLVCCLLPLCLVVCCVFRCLGLVFGLVFPVFLLVLFCLFCCCLVGCLLRSHLSQCFPASRHCWWLVRLCLRYWSFRLSWLLCRHVLLTCLSCLVGGADCSRQEPWTRLHCSELHWRAPVALPVGSEAIWLAHSLGEWCFFWISWLTLWCCYAASSLHEDSLGAPEQSSSYYTAPVTVHVLVKS